MKVICFRILPSSMFFPFHTERKLYKVTIAIVEDFKFLQTD